MPVATQPSTQPGTLPATARHFVILPGMEGSGKTQALLAKALTEYGEVYSLSYPPDRICPYEELATSLPWPEVPHVIVASSYGGPLALRRALARHELVQAVVLLGSFAAAPIRFGPSLSVLTPLLFRRPPPRSRIARALGKQADEELIELAHAAVSAPSGHVMRARLREVLRGDLRAALPALRQPVLYLRGLEDTLVGTYGLASLANVPRLTVRTVPTGHFMALTEPEACAREIVSFLRIHD